VKSEHTDSPVSAVAAKPTSLDFGVIDDVIGRRKNKRAEKVSIIGDFWPKPCYLPRSLNLD